MVSCIALDVLWPILLRSDSNFMKGGDTLFLLLSSSGSSSSGTLTSILSAATELVTWIISALGSFLSFITSNPVILVLFLMMLVSFAVGVLFRIWRSTGV